MVIEVLLHLFHLFAGGLLGIFLHSGVDSGINFQARAVKIISVFIAPWLKILSNCLTEIYGLSIVILFNFKVKGDRCIL